jgi:16S rRNA (guanine527-N7)-methyltransferase
MLKNMQHKIDAYVSLLLEWQQRCNLVAKNDAVRDILYTRHVEDCLRLVPIITPLITKDTVMVDMGSGAGFPGLILAITLNHPIHLVEATGKKVAFLKAVGDALSLPITVHHHRLEHMPHMNADIVTARALAPLDRLLGYAVRHLKQSGCAILMKGETVEQEIVMAKKQWTFRCEVPMSSAKGVIKIDSIAPVSQKKKHDRKTPSR